MSTSGKGEIEAGLGSQAASTSSSSSGGADPSSLSSSSFASSGLRPVHGRIPLTAEAERSRKRKMEERIEAEVKKRMADLATEAVDVEEVERRVADAVAAGQSAVVVDTDPARQTTLTRDTGPPPLALLVLVWSWSFLLLVWWLLLVLLSCLCRFPWPLLARSRSCLLCWSWNWW
jgi:hypothetical protein